MQKRTLCAWLPRWPIERLAAARPELDGRPVMLYEQSSRGGLRTVAFAAGRQAAGDVARGLRPGLPLAEAIALYEHALHQRARPKKSKLPALHVEAHDPTADRLALEALAQECQQFSPLVGLEDAPRPQSLLLDVSGLAAIFGGEARLAELVARHLAERGLTVQVAIADTPGAAWAVARYAAPAVAVPTAPSSAPLKAQGLHPWVSTSQPAASQPAPTTIVPAGAALAALAPLPLAALRLSASTVEMLAELGVRRIGQLAALPRATLVGRFGEELPRRIDQLLQTSAEVVNHQKPAEPLAAEWIFEYPTERRELMERVLDELLVRLTAPLAGERKGILRLACRLVRSESRPVQFEVGLYRPSGSVRHLRELIGLRLEGLQFRASRRSPIESVQLSVTSAAPLAAEQQELFLSANSREAPRPLAALVDRLASRLGRQAVLRPCLLADAQPEYACQYLPLDAAVRRAKPAKRTKADRPAAMAGEQGERPLRLLTTPQPIQATSIVPDGPPLRFRFQGQEQRIVQTWGPERIETGWWRASASGTGEAGGTRTPGARSSFVRRDYYRVESSTGSRFWIFRSLHDGRWFLHGEFV